MAGLWGKDGAGEVGELVAKVRRLAKRKSTLPKYIVQLQDLNIRKGTGKVNTDGIVVGLVEMTTKTEAERKVKERPSSSIVSMNGMLAHG